MRQELNTHFKHFKEISGGNGDHLNLLKTRLYSDRPLLRGFFGFQVAAYLKGSDHIEMLYKQKIPFLLEALMTILYLQNHQLDGKCGIDLFDRRRNIANVDQISLLLHLLEYIKHSFTGPQADIITRHVLSIVESCNRGQRLEVMYNTLTSYYRPAGYLRHVPSNYASKTTHEHYVDWARSIITRSLPKLDKRQTYFLDIYLYRICLVNASFYMHGVKMVAELLGLAGTEQAVLFTEWAGRFGVLRQIVNDNIDYLPKDKGMGTLTRSHEDALSDFRNRIVTMPLYVYLVNKFEGPVGDFLSQSIREPKRQQLSVQEQHLVTQNLLQTGSIGIAKNIGKHLAEEIMAQLPDKYNMLRNMCGVAFRNRFYNAYDD